MGPPLGVQAEQKMRKGFLPSWHHLSTHIPVPRETRPGPEPCGCRGDGPQIIKFQDLPHLFLSPLNCSFRDGSPCSGDLPEVLILGLQEFATPWPPDPESNALAVRGPPTCSLGPFQSRSLQGLQRGRQRPWQC